MAPPTIALTTVKRFTYRGDTTEEFSNQYLFSGSTPSSGTAWKTLADELIGYERTLFSNKVAIVAAYGYDQVPTHGTHAVWSNDYLLPTDLAMRGNFAVTTNIQTPGDCAAWIRWALDRYNSKGKRIYLRKYYHDVYLPSTGGDAITATQVTAYNAFGAQLRTGLSSGSSKLVDKLGNLTIGTATSPFVTTRTLKRRGKRPPT